MSLPTLIRRVLPVVLLGIVAACARDTAGPRQAGTYHATLRLVPMLPSVSGGTHLDSVVVDSINLAITNDADDTLGLQGVAFPPGQDSVVVTVDVDLDSASQTVTAHVDILANGVVVYRQVWRLTVSVTSQINPHSDSIPLFSAIWQALESETEIALPGRVGLTAVYDTGKQVVVAFGGATEAGISGETWMLKGGEWKQVQAAGPAARVGQGMVFDAGRGVTVLFGGATASSFSNETWAFDAAAKSWTQVTTTGTPSARGEGALAYDGIRGRIVLFGGYTSSGFLNETWEFTWTGPASGAWTRVLTSAAPTPRAGTALVYDAALGKTVLFGGLDANLKALQDTWTYDGTSWTQVCGACAPPVRAAHRMAYDPAGRVLLFGGATSHVEAGSLRHNDLWAFDGTTWTQLWADNPSAGPSKRAGMAMAYDVKRASLVVISGLSATGLESDTWLWNGTSWAQTATAPLLSRSQHGLVFDLRHGVAIMYGGASGDTVTWSFDGRAWRPVAFAGPGIRTAPAMAFDSVAGVVVLFGGSRAGSPLADTWIFDGTAWSNPVTTGSPPARSGAAMVYDVRRGRVVMFGGQGAAGALADTWEYNTATATWTQASTATAPPARSGAAMAFDRVLGKDVLFGGVAGAASLGDTWTYGATGWTQVTTVHAPSARSGAAMAFEGSRGKSVLFGGSAAGTKQADLWVFDGADWTVLYPATSPSARSSTAMSAWAGGSILLFGGSATSGDLADTWLFR